MHGAPIAVGAKVLFSADRKQNGGSPQGSPTPSADGASPPVPPAAAIMFAFGK